MDYIYLEAPCAHECGATVSIPLPRDAWESKITKKIQCSKGHVSRVEIEASKILSVTPL